MANGILLPVGSYNAVVIKPGMRIPINDAGDLEYLPPAPKTRCKHCKGKTDKNSCEHCGAPQ
jgi:hypothetical protein